ncbi:MAG TPA: ribonuclease domain-containing protein [Isosphaeraceae bacterium]
MPSRPAFSRLRTALAIALALASLPAAARAQAVGTMPRRERLVVIPATVEAVLRAIDESGQAPPGHVGGGPYHNSGRQGEQLLPKIDRDGDPIAYRTWDVNASGAGRGRGAERLVTGSDGSAYYSPDDYRTFATVRNPARSSHDGPDHARTFPPAPDREPPRPPPSNRDAPAPGNAVVALDPKTAARVNPVVDYVLAHGEPPPGYVGGREYRNLGLDGGAVLPRFDDRGRPIRYREWDVNPKVPGRNRGAERIVSGSDGRVYYTRDHYMTFGRIR